MKTYTVSLERVLTQRGTITLAGESLIDVVRMALKLSEPDNIIAPKWSDIAVSNVIATEATETK